MDLQLQAALDEFSVIAVWSAITIYVLAYDLSQRASAAPVKPREAVLVGVAGGTVPSQQSGAAEASLRLSGAERSRHYFARPGIPYPGAG